jgi:hypothetical protein
VAEPIPRENLPGAPEGADVTAWRASLPAGTVLKPRMTMALLMHVSWLRWAHYAELLRVQVGEDAGESGTGGLVGYRVGMSPVNGGEYEQAEVVRALAELEGAERDRCARLAKTAFDMGLEADT